MFLDGWFIWVESKRRKLIPGGDGLGMGNIIGRLRRDQIRNLYLCEGVTIFPLRATFSFLHWKVVMIMKHPSSLNRAILSAWQNWVTPSLSPTLLNIYHNN